MQPNAAGRSKIRQQCKGGSASVEQQQAVQMRGQCNDCSAMQSAAKHCEKVQDQAVQHRPSLQSIAKKEAGSDSEAGVR